MTIIGAAPPPQDNAMIVEGTDMGFMKDVMEASMQMPVIVDFWAPWCGPCRQLTPALEQAVRDAGGKVKLVKMNTDIHPGVAGQLRVQSLPTVYAFVAGRPVDGFMGAKPPSEVKAFVDRLIGGGEDDADDVDAYLSQAEESVAMGDVGGAAQGFAQVLSLQPENLKAIAGLAKCYFLSGDAERATETLGLAPKDKQSAPELQAVRGLMALAEEAGDPSTLPVLRAAVSVNPSDHASLYGLAKASIALGQFEAAMDALLQSISADREWNEQAARKLLIKIFDGLGSGDDLVKAGRRRLSAVWLS